jgi:hypothetical protein
MSLYRDLGAMPFDSWPAFLAQFNSTAAGQQKAPKR